MSKLDDYRKLLEVAKAVESDSDLEAPFSAYSTSVRSKTNTMHPHTWSLLTKVMNHEAERLLAAVRCLMATELEDALRAAQDEAIETLRLQP